MKHPEQQLHFAVADYLNAALPIDAWWTTVGHGGFALDARTGARMKRAGMKAGVPDILIVYQGCAHWLELKSPTGKTSTAQRECAGALMRAGCSNVYVCRSISDVETSLIKYGIPLRARIAA